MTNRENNWPFDESPDIPVITTRQVLELIQPIRYALHYAHDDSWSFVCGTTNEQSDYRVVHMRHLLELDPSVREVAGLPSGWSAWREDGEGPWERFEEELDSDSSEEM